MIRAVYIHIPFCSFICSYCDFPKMFYNENIVSNYLNNLKQEIKKNYQNETIETIYIGGGTPSCLSCDEISKLFEIISIFKTTVDTEITFECNIENITEEKLNLLKKYKVNRLSIGIQTFDSKYITLLNRKHNEKEVFDKISYMKKLGFDNISIDLIYAIPGQTLEDLENDIDKFLKLDINHIATYSLIIEPHTILSINKISNIDDELDYQMYQLIKNKLKEKGFDQYETSNFSKPNYQSKHNLVYWNNEEYYGFGLGSSGYVKNIRYTNTRSITKYLNGETIKDKYELTLKESLENEFILGLRKIKGINKNQFKNKFNIDIYNIDVVKKLINEQKLIDDGNNIFIAPDYLYLANEVLVNFIFD